MLEIGKVYRLSRREKNPDVIEVDGLPNFFHETAIPHAGTQFEVQRGIHVFAKVKGPDGKERIPMIFITSSPHKAGSEVTPWKDTFDPKHGVITYYGDNKHSDRDPESVAGNRALLNLLEIYRNSDSEIRAKEAVPLLFFERVTVDGRVKGNLKFHGFGIVTEADLVNQSAYNKSSKDIEYFPNYKFMLSIFSLRKEQEKFDFIKWIGARYDTSLTAEETNEYAPQSWQEWIGLSPQKQEEKPTVLPAKSIVRYSSQLPIPGSSEYKLLSNIYELYSDDENTLNFEKLALEVTKKVIEDQGNKCITGWVLKKTDVYEKDFIARVDIGDDILTGVCLSLVGHAVCARPTQAINNTDIQHIYDLINIAGITAFVSTSFYSENVQIEVNNSKKPIILINGKTIAEIVAKELTEKNISIEEYVKILEDRYQCEEKDIEEILISRL